MNRPQADEFAPYYGKYIETVDNDVLSELETQASAFPEFLRSLPEGKGDYAYDEGKWTIKELVGHMIDTERIFAYRTLRFSRNDATNLPGFEENDYVRNAHFNDRTLNSLADEFAALREANLFLIRSLNDEELNRRG